MATQRGLEIVAGVHGPDQRTKARRPGLDQMMADARRGRFDIVLVWASDRIARSVKHFLEVLDELNRLNIEYVSFREQIDTGGPLGRAIVIIIGAIAELERNLIIERVRAGMRRASSKARTSAAIRWNSIAKRSSGIAAGQSLRPDRQRPSHLADYRPARAPQSTPQPLRSKLHERSLFRSDSYFVRHRRPLRDDLRDPQARRCCKEIKLIRQAVEKNLAETQAMHHNLRRQRGAINQMHRYLIPSTKGVKNPTSINSLKSRPDLTDPAVP